MTTAKFLQLLDELRQLHEAESVLKNLLTKESQHFMTPKN